MPKNFLKFNSKKGQSLIEWSVAILAVSVLTMSTLFAFAPQMKGVLQKIQTELNTNTQ